MFIVQPPRPPPNIILRGKDIPKDLPPAPDGPEPCYVMLGAFGDLCAMIPFFYFRHRTTKKPVNVVVAKTYAPLFDGVSYVNPIVYQGDYSEVGLAIEFAKQQARGNSLQPINPPPMVVQAFGHPAKPQRMTDSFIKEMWRFVGHENDWDRYPLVFDKRDYDREFALAEKHIHNKDRVMLVAGVGRSSPFPHKDELVRLLTGEFQDFQVIDMAEVVAEKPYDLLGLFDRAQLLMASDTFQLHLSRASSIPVFAFHVNKPTPWNSSPSYLNQFARLTYDQFPENQQWIVGLIRNRLKPIKLLGQTKLIHVFSQYEGRQGDTLRRHLLASASWNREYQFANWKQVPILDSEVKRTSELCGDSDRKLPFVKDIVELALKKGRSSPTNVLPDDTIIVLTNDDTCFVPGISQMILRQVGMAGAVFAHRFDFYARLSRLLEPAEIRRGTPHPGQDLFAFTVRWWKAHADEFPDFVLGCEAWDWILRELIKKYCGGEIVEGVYHEWHPPFWAQHRLENKANVYNRNLAREWLAQHGLPLGMLDFSE